MAGNNTSKVARLKVDCAEACDRAVASMQAAMAELSEKRVTLEEKMITNYFQGLIEKLQSAKQALGAAGTADDSSPQTEECLVTLNALVKEVDETVNELLHKIAYNLNYLEQYYEHDFYDRLAYELRYEERLEDATRALKTILGR